MRKTFATIFTLVAIALFCSFTVTEDWLLFEKENFKMLFPGQPEVDSTETKSPIGQIKIYTYMFERPDNSEDSNVVYGLVLTNFPAKYLTSVDTSMLRGIYDGAVKGAVQTSNGKLLSDKSVMIKNYAGREIVIDILDGAAILTMRLVMIKQTMFGFQTIALKGKESNINAVKFFDSFELK